MGANKIIGNFSPKNKFSQDVLWNLCSLAVLGIAGIGINIIVGSYRGAAALGVFNQIYAFYIMFSQFGVGGVQLSVLKHLSHTDDQSEIVRIAGSALMLTTGLGFFVCLIATIIVPFLEPLHESPEVTLGLLYMGPGIFFFSINKVLLNIINAVRQMKSFAVYQALRYIFLTLALIALIYLSAPNAFLSQSLCIAEAALFFVLLVHVNKKVCHLRLNLGYKWRLWIKRHFKFGLKGFLSGVLVECNTRVDVLMLGFFLDDAKVGIYSFAAILVEGFAQVPYIIRRNLDPIIGKMLAEQQYIELVSLHRKIRNRFFPMMAGISLIAILIYPVAVKILTNNPEFNASISVFIILMSGLLISSTIRPMLGALLQGGYPADNTILIAIVVLSNIMLNLLFIPFWGINGAAIATGIVFNIEVILLSIMVYRRLGVVLAPIG